jgi:hypothetical protein
MATAIKASVTSALDPTFPIEGIRRVSLDLTSVGAKGKVAFLLKNVFTAAECEKLIGLSEGHGYKPAMINFADGRAVLAPGYRDGHRVMIDDKEFVQILFNRISTFLPQEFDRCTLLRINGRLRFLRYGPNDKFMAHEDGYYETEEAETFITLQMYLNEGFEGGATTFLKGTASDAQRVPVIPETGMVLVFQHDILHEGSVVLSGTKYTIRGDVLYEYPQYSD